MRSRAVFRRLFSTLGMVLLLVIASDFASHSLFAAPTEIQYLSGTDKDSTVLWDFRVSAGRNSGVWTNLPVPSCWETKGFGSFEFFSTNTSEFGEYRCSFSVPPTWSGKKIFLIFEGSLTDTDAKVNGVTVGPTHQGGFVEFRYDVTTNVVFGGTNLLEVTVHKLSSNTSINRAERNADYWGFSGIARPVYLEARPNANIDRVAVDARANGQITVNAFLSGLTNGATVAAFLTDSNQSPFGLEFSTPVSAGATSVTFSSTLASPRLWSAEFPNLYQLTVELRSGTNTVHTVTDSIGFRTVTFTNNVGFFVNGRKIILRGANRHEFWPTSGRTSSRAVSILDIALMKDMNMNAVRMSHYPPAKHFLEECDRLGLYVLDELPGWQKAYDNTVASNMVYQLIVRDVNHPSIIAWNNGNEGGHNTTVDQNGAGTTNVYAIWDPQNRKVLRPTTGNSSAFNNVVTRHYASYSAFTNLLGAGLPVYLTTEILHAIYDGGGGAALADHWNAMRNAPNGGGMFIWAFLDEGVVRDDHGGAIDHANQSAPDGVVGPFREKEASYYTIKALWSPLQISAPNPVAFNGTLTVTNGFDFTSLDQCTFEWQLGWFPDAADPAQSLTNGWLIAANSGAFNGPPIVPGASGSLVWPSFPGNWTNCDALRLTAKDPFGNCVYAWTWPLHSQSQIRDRMVGDFSTSAPGITASTTTTEIILTNGPRVFRFSRVNGVINSLIVSNQPVSFTNGPAPVAGSWPVSSITNYSDGTNYFIAVNDLNSSSNAFQWTLRPDGWLRLLYRYTLTGPRNFMGITFDYPSNSVTGMTWLGQGPYRVWKNRIEGQEVSVHQKAINNTWTAKSSNYGSPSWMGTQWVYPEFAGYHGRFYWATLETTQQPITIVTPTPDLFFRVLSPPLTDIGNVNPVFPPGSISLLHGISAMGNKFAAAATTGPSGATNIATGLYTGEANFFFGLLPASGADRDGNSLIDAWELKHFNALGQNPDFDPDGDGVSLLLENAFDLSPILPDANSPRLPQRTAGGSTPAALLYSVPRTQLDFFDFIPGLSDDLKQWFWADAYPNYFLITTVSNGLEDVHRVEPNLSTWSGNADHLFLRLQIKQRN